MEICISKNTFILKDEKHKKDCSESVTETEANSGYLKIDPSQYYVPSGGLFILKWLSTIFI